MRIVEVKEKGMEAHEVKGLDGCELVISDETIDNVSILAKLELSPKEKEQAKQEMNKMLTYIHKLEELDTTETPPMSQVFPIQNVFREDIVENDDNREAILKNAPAKKDGSFVVPKTLG